MEVGDVVRLKSGGPRMTIASIDMVWARCIWFSYGNDSEVKEALLRLACLEREVPPVAREESDDRLRTLRAYKAELRAAAEAEAEASATGDDLVAAVKRRLRAEEAEARLSEEPGTF